jgi:hypothetical protein
LQSLTIREATLDDESDILSPKTTPDLFIASESGEVAPFVKIAGPVYEYCGHYIFEDANTQTSAAPTVGIHVR